MISYEKKVALFASTLAVGYFVATEILLTAEPDTAVLSISFLPL